MYIQKEEAEKFIELVNEYDTIILHRHVRPDPDAIGSQLGLKEMLTTGYPNKKVLAAGSDSPTLEWLGTMDKVTASDYEGALVIVTDTADAPRIDGKHFEKADKIVKIDHHPPVDQYGDMQIVYTVASSASEMVVLLSYMLEDKLPMTKAAANYLYAGIVGDTGRFMFNSTTATTMRLTAWLFDQGINAHAINNQMQLLTPGQTKFNGYVLDNLEINEEGLASITITRDLMEEYGVSEEETNSAVNLAQQIEGVYCWVMFVEQAEGDVKYRVRLRSKGPVVNEIASKHDGGGHAMASGANAYSDEEVEEIINELTQATKEHIQNNPQLTKAPTMK